MGGGFTETECLYSRHLSRSGSFPQSFCRLHTRSDLYNKIIYNFLVRHSLFTSTKHPAGKALLLLYNIMPKAPPSTTTQRMSPYPMPNTQRPSRPSSPRPSGGAWSPQDDETLKTARSEGLSWAPIAQIYFPNKTGNACRKRHERLSEKKKGDNWDSLKLEQLAREYLDVRKDMWDMLASRVGEKWQDVEAIVRLLILPVAVSPG